MYRTDNPTSSPTLPPSQPVGPNPNSYFTIGSPGTVPATVVDADFMNSVQEEICNVITGAGITLTKTVRNQLSTAINELIAVETERAEAAEATKAPIANPAFTGGGTIVGSFTAGGTIQALTIQTTPTGSLNIGTGTSYVGGTLSVGGALSALNFTTGGAIETTSAASTAVYAPNGGVYAAGLYTTTAGSLHVGNGASNINGSLVVGGAATFDSTVYAYGQLTSSSEINNPWFSSSAGGFLIAQTLTCTSSVSVSGNLTVSGGGGTGSSWTVGNTLIVSAGMSTFEGGATVYGAMNFYSVGVGEGVLECQVPTGGNGAALESNLALVGGGTSFTTFGGGYYLGIGGVASYSGETTTFGLITSQCAQASYFFASSDVRLKENFEPITDDEGYAFIRGGRPMRYDWRTGGKRNSGYIAQQLVTAGFPDLVGAIGEDGLQAETHEFDGVTITSQANIKLMARYDDMIAYLHAALRGALARIEVLEARS